MPDGLSIAIPGGGVYFSDRSDGNMSSVGGAGHEHGAEARERLRERLGLQRLARGYQVHGAHVSVVRSMPAREAETGELEHADGQATPLPALGAMVLAADCLPVAIAGEGAVAMIHAGWRGLAAGVIESGVRAVGELDGEALVAVMGPCAGPCCYEVGPEVHEALGTPIAGRRRASRATPTPTCACPPAPAFTTRASQRCARSAAARSATSVSSPTVAKARRRGVRRRSRG